MMDPDATQAEEVVTMPQVAFDSLPSVFSVVRKTPPEFAKEIKPRPSTGTRRGRFSQGKAAEIAGVSRSEFLEELFRRLRV